jgi:hypothetical protein
VKILFSALIGLAAGFCVFEVGNSWLYPGAFIFVTALGLASSFSALALKNSNRLLGLSINGFSMWIVLASLNVFSAPKMKWGQAQEFIVVSALMIAFIFSPALLTASWLKFRDPKKHN